MLQYPFFVVIVVGYLLKRIGWINQGFIEASNKINFKVTLPALFNTGHGKQ